MNRKTKDIIRKVDKEDGNRLIIVWGMKCVGKTYAVLDYVKSEYEEYLYIDAAHDQSFIEYAKIYAGCGINELLSGFFKIEEEYLVNIPIILDELSMEMIENISFEGYNGSLKLFVIFSDKNRADRLYSKITDDEASKTENQENIIHITPMNFGDFLVALGKEWYDEVITGHLMSRRKLPEMIHEELLDLYDLYLQIGGMPEIVEEYLKTGSLENIRERQQLLKAALWSTFSRKNIDPQVSDVTETKILGVLDAVEKILEKDNHKFMYSAIRDGVTKKQYAGTVEYLLKCDTLFSLSKLTPKVTKAKSSKQTVDKETGSIDIQENNEFRLYNSDFSMYDRPYGLKLAESSVLQGIKSSGVNTFYWESGTGAELACVLENNGKYTPVDIHINGKGRGRSVSAFQKEFGCRQTIRLTEENCRFEEDVVTLPIYVAYSLKHLL